MRFRLEQPLPAPSDAAIDVLADPAFLATLSESPVLARPELLDCRREGDRICVRVRHRFAGRLSPAVTAVVDPDKLLWIEETTYERGDGRATLRITPEHYTDRLRAHGTYQFVDLTPDRCTWIAQGEVTVRFPFVGGKVERAIVDGLDRHQAQEAGLVARWLGR